MDGAKGIQMIIKYTHTHSNFSFYFLEHGEPIPVTNWGKIQSEFLSQFAILTELQDNGQADYTEYSCDVENLDVLKLSDSDKQILHLPNAYPYEILIESDGVLTHNTFKFKYGFYDFCPNGTKLVAKRNGAIISINENEYLLTENQYQVCEGI